jgi:hypothetical protein
MRSGPDRATAVPEQLGMQAKTYVSNSRLGVGRI